MPVAITVLVGIYIILNGNNRVGHAFRRGLSWARNSLEEAWRTNNNGSVPPRYDMTLDGDRNRGSNADDNHDSANETSLSNESRRRDEVNMSRVNINLPQTRSLSLSPDDGIPSFDPSRTAYSDSNIRIH